VYAWARVEADGGSFWLPASFFADPTEEPAAAAGPPSGGGATTRAGQVGRNCFVKMPNGEPDMLVTTAMSILQPEVGKPDRERLRRFQLGRSRKTGSDAQHDDVLETDEFFALVLPSRQIHDAAVVATTFRVGVLTKMSRIAPGKAAATLTTAKIVTSGLRATFVVYERNENGTYSRSDRQFVADLDDGDVRVICRLSVTTTDHGDVALGPNVEGLLARRSFVHERAGSERISVVVRVAPPQGRKKRRRAPPPLPFTITNEQAIGVVTASDCIFDASGSPQGTVQPGDVILSVNNESTATSSEARATLRAVLSDVQTDGGGDVPVLLWRPPADFLPAQPVEPSTQTPSASTTKPLTKRDFSYWTDQEMRNLRRITTCLYGGAKTKKNVAAICKALGIEATGSIPALKILIEQDLRDRGFVNDTTWKPTDTDLDDIAKVEEVPAHYLPPLVKHLRDLPRKIGAA